MGDEELMEAWHAMCKAALDLLLNAGIMLVGIQNGPYPEHVREGYSQKLKDTTEALDSTTGEFQNFGDAFD